MVIYKAYKFRLLPSRRQVKLLRKHIGCARYAYNWALNQKKMYYEQNKKALHYAELSRVWTQHKREKEFLQDVSKWVTANALRNVEKAFSGFFRRVKQGIKPGYPKFKSKRHSKQSCTFTNDKILVEVNSSTIKLPVLGWIKMKQHRNIPGKILSATVSCRAGRWFVSVTTEQDAQVQSNQGSPVGVDVGITYFATLSTGEKIENPRHIDAKLRLLRRCSKQLSRKKSASKNREKAKTKLAVLHWRISNRRKDFLHKLSHRLATKYSLIVCEDLAVANMVKNPKLARSISDVGWGEFYRQLDYKSKWYGSEFQQVARFFPSSKKCSSCGLVKNDLKLSDRNWVCSCGIEHDRDLNAALNILAAGSAVAAC